MRPGAAQASAAGAPVARVLRAGASGNDVTTGDPLYVKARHGVVLGFCGTVTSAPPGERVL